MLAWGIPRVLWVLALIVFLIWVLKFNYGLNYTETNIYVMLNMHYLFMFLAFPVFMAEAILSYRVPIITLGSRR